MVLETPPPCKPCKVSYEETAARDKEMFADGNWLFKQCWDCGRFTVPMEGSQVGPSKLEEFIQREGRGVPGPAQHTEIVRNEALSSPGPEPPEPQDLDAALNPVIAVIEFWEAKFDDYLGQRVTATEVRTHEPAEPFDMAMALAEIKKCVEGIQRGGGQE